MLLSRQKLLCSSTLGALAAACALSPQFDLWGRDSLGNLPLELHQRPLSLIKAVECLGFIQILPGNCPEYFLLEFASWVLFPHSLVRAALISCVCFAWV